MLANLAHKRCVLSILNANGKSRKRWIEAVVYAVPVFEVTALWKDVHRVYGKFLTAKNMSINSAYIY
jgi:hypothetical protein